MDSLVIYIGRHSLDSLVLCISARVAVQLLLVGDEVLENIGYVRPQYGQ